jgi:L-lactate dehydrogenase complex protein LldG
LPPVTRSKSESWGAPAQSGDARATILGRIRSALSDRPPPVEVPRDYRRKTERSRSEVVDLFAERAGEYRATVVRAAHGELARTLSELCDAQGARRLVVPPDLPSEWRPAGAELVPDTMLAPDDLDAIDGVLTGCALAIAETGTVVLDAGAAQGRRALTLVPDYHLCVIGEDQIVDLVPEAIEALAPALKAGRPLTFVSGPSATSDIELNRVEGVHGPRRLELVIAAPS